MTTRSLEEKFATQKKLQEYSEQLVADRKALDEAVTVFLREAEEHSKKVHEDINKIHGFLTKFREFREQYVKVTEKIMDEISNLKSLHEMTNMNKRLFKKLME